MVGMDKGMVHASVPWVGVMGRVVRWRHGSDFPFWVDVFLDRAGVGWGVVDASAPWLV